MLPIGECQNVKRLTQTIHNLSRVNPTSRAMAAGIAPSWSVRRINGRGWMDYFTGNSFNFVFFPVAHLKISVDATKTIFIDVNCTFGRIHITKCGLNRMAATILMWQATNLFSALGFGISDDALCWVCTIKAQFVWTKNFNIKEALWPLAPCIWRVSVSYWKMLL